MNFLAGGQFHIKKPAAAPANKKQIQAKSGATHQPADYSTARPGKTPSMPAKHQYHP